ncbi:MAG TPA: hypothetical protein VMF89_09325 [Polyangiales bacterium]|nr:hypothetical protein [Polyangiales bacterium]
MLGFAFSGHAAAQEGQNDCSVVYDEGRDAEREGDLHAALELYQSCAQESCANPVRRSCEARALRLELDAPSIVPLANTADGQPLVDADVTMDGKLLTSRLDGLAIAVEPGLHDFVFSKHGEVFGQVRLVIAQGQRNREIWMTEQASEQPQRMPTVVLRREPILAAPRAATSVSEVDHGGPGATPYLLGGAALLGGGAYALLSTWARSDNEQLSRCAPNCSKDSVEHIRRLYLAADVSLGVGIAAAVGSIASFLLAPSSSDDKPVALSVQPQRTGALATFRGTL